MGEAERLVTGSSKTLACGCYVQLRQARDRMVWQVTAPAQACFHHLGAVVPEDAPERPAPASMTGVVGPL